LFDADIGGYGWDSDKDSSDHFMPTARKRAREHLEAAAPHMLPDLAAIVGEAWDDGNCVGLDGWVGPARGEPVDRDALSYRERAIRKYAK